MAKQQWHQDLGPAIVPSTSLISHWPVSLPWLPLPPKVKAALRYTLNMGYPSPAGQLEGVYLEEAVMFHHLVLAALRHVPLPSKESWDCWSRGGRWVAHLSSWSKVANGLKTHRLKSILHQVQGQVSFPWLPRDRGHLPEWDVFLLVPILGLITLPQNRKRRAL